MNDYKNGLNSISQSTGADNDEGFSREHPGKLLKDDSPSSTIIFNDNNKPIESPPVSNEAPTGHQTEFQNIADKFKLDYDNALKKLHEIAPPQNAKIEVKANAVAVNANDSDKIPDTGKVDGLNKSYSKLGKTVQGVNTDIDEQNIKIKESAELQRDLENVAVGSFTAVGEALGKMMAGQKNVNPLAAIMKQMADALKKYGEFLITAGTAMIFGGDPAGTAKIGEGIALEAVGTAMGAIKMASGGIVSGSTFANIGEYAGANRNPEVVAPLDKLQGMLGGGNVHHMEARISGDDLVFVTNRVSRFNQNSTGGGLGNY